MEATQESADRRRILRQTRSPEPAAKLHCTSLTAAFPNREEGAPVETAGKVPWERGGICLYFLLILMEDF